MGLEMQYTVLFPMKISSKKLLSANNLFGVTYKQATYKILRTQFAQLIKDLLKTLSTVKEPPKKQVSFFPITTNKSCVQ